MKFRIVVTACLTLTCGFPAHAAGDLVNTTTITASALIAPGRYSVSVAPSFNSGMDKRLEKALETIPGLHAVKARPADSSIRFTVKEGSHIQLSDIQKIVKKTDNGAVVSVPVLEGSMSTQPGL